MIYLGRFVEGQAVSHEQALAELHQGHKQGHWMWFVFPQVAGLGHSPMARRYAITSIREARAYLADPVLGTRLRECAGAMLTHDDLTAEQILGSVDARKLRSSMTLFAQAAGPAEPIFRQVLDRFYDAEPDPATLEILDRRRFPGRRHRSRRDGL